MNDDNYTKMATDTFGVILGLGLPGLTPVDMFPIRELHGSPLLDPERH